MKYCFLDLETTGFSETKDPIIEISFIVRNESGKEIDRFDEVIIPGKSPLTPFITSLTGITQQEIDTEGKLLETVREEAREKIGDAAITGHNIDFDIKFLIANGIDVSKNLRIDTHELARIMLIREDSYALEVLSQKYGFMHKEAHRALSDVEASMDLFDFLQEKIQALPTKFIEEIRPILEMKTEWTSKQFF